MSQVLETSIEVIHIFVEIDRHTKKRLEFDTDQVTGAEIKTKAAVPLEDDLARRHGQKLDLVTNEQTITIKNGEHFVVFPPGTIS
jgi:hypothetical protein